MEDLTNFVYLKTKSPQISAQFTNKSSSGIEKWKVRIPYVSRKSGKSQLVEKCGFDSKQQAEKWSSVLRDFSHSDIEKMRKEQKTHRNILDMEKAFLKTLVTENSTRSSEASASMASAKGRPANHSQQPVAVAQEEERRAAQLLSHDHRCRNFAASGICTNYHTTLSPSRNQKPEMYICRYFT